MKKIIISWLLVIIWAGFIFYNSSKSAVLSSSDSRAVVNIVVSKTINVTNKLGITKAKLNKTSIKQIVDKLHNPVRKIAHAVEYFVLAILLCIAFLCSKIDKKLFIYSILICFLYAISDEVHQIFVSGRSCEIRDILIDTIGGSIGYILFYLIYHVKYVKFNKKLV